MTEGERVAFIEFLGGAMRPVYEDDLGQYVIDDFGQRVAGTWDIPRDESADNPLRPKNCNRPVAFDLLGCFARCNLRTLAPIEYDFDSMRIPRGEEWFGIHVSFW